MEDRDPASREGDEVTEEQYKRTKFNSDLNFYLLLAMLIVGFSVLDHKIDAIAHAVGVK